MVCLRNISVDILHKGDTEDDDDDDDNNNDNNNNIGLFNVIYVTWRGRNRMTDCDVIKSSRFPLCGLKTSNGIQHD
jgi:hypothetical protein